MYYFAIIDDNGSDLTQIEKEINEHCHFHNIEYHIDLYINPNDYNLNKYYDAIFLDIDMPQINGLQLANKINNSNPTKVIFITNYDNYMQVTFNVHPFHFIRKSNLKLEMIKVLNHLFKILSNEHLVLKTKEGIKKIKYKEIYFIKVEDNLSTIHTYDASYHIWESLSSLYEKLKPYYFEKINKSIIVNMKHINNIKDKEIIMNNNYILNISIRTKSSFIKKYKNYLLKEY